MSDIIDKFRQYSLEYRRARRRKRIQSLQTVIAFLVILVFLLPLILQSVLPENLLFILEWRNVACGALLMLDGILDLCLIDSRNGKGVAVVAVIIGLALMSFGVVLIVFAPPVRALIGF